MKVLLAEDDLRLGKLIMKMLKKEQYTADWVEDGREAYVHALTGDYDVIILDWMLPEQSGIQVSQSLRKEDYKGAILMLTARDALEDRVNGLDAGADDYMAKPFAFEELFARMRSLGRRTIYPIEHTIITTHDLFIDLSSHVIKKGDETLSLTSREFQLLIYLVKNSGRVLSKEMILSKVWETHGDVTFNTMEAYVKLLRKKLGQTKQNSYIKTVRGSGYMWEDRHV
ncbi:response regulator transcription factor [Sporolactobacillus sp. CPB3-1]|uniref:Response regulator transcription factor n=1 Tax=Sporolactobacillus mangiferae TaxID=2940498 RepID=A0ABT0M680_9BACL|nr:response regulator transcription factor [Sporolactobacillus mangiferae]MCL1630365.1 response regulator transcription factor [Sporolactobacillus mangiferae]